MQTTFNSLNKIWSRLVENEKLDRLDLGDDSHLGNDAFEVGKDNVLLGYHGNERDIVVPDGIVGIDGAFLNHDDLVSIKIPNSVKSISDDSFKGCKRLRTIFVSNREQEKILRQSKHLPPKVEIMYHGGNGPIQARCDTITQSGIRENQFLLRVGQLNAWLKNTDTQENYDDIIDRILSGKEVTVHLKKPISAVRLIMRGVGSNP